MIVYKLFRQRKDGTIGSLFINASYRIPIGVWMKAEDHRKNGFAHRPGWHCTLKPLAPHLSLNPKYGNPRVWAECEARDTTEFERPERQGGIWVLAQELKVIRLIELSE